MALIAARLNAGVILVVIDTPLLLPPPDPYSLPPFLQPPFSPSLISLVVSVDVKHHVYLLIPPYPLPSLLPVPNKPWGFCGR